MSKNKKEQPKGTDENKPLNNPHDKFFKAIFTMRTVVEEYLDNLFPKHLLAKLDIETLELDTTSHITPELEEFFSDIVWRCKFRDKEEYGQICFIFEHKSYVPKYPNVQIGDYKQGAYNKQIKTKQPLQIVMPIIVFHGEKEWIVKPFSSYFGDIDPAFHGYIDPLAYHLTNLSDYSDEMIEAFNMALLGRAFLALKHFKDKQYLKTHFVKLLFLGYQKNNSEEKSDYVRVFCVYLYTIIGAISVEEIDKQVKLLSNNQNSEIMVNYLDVIKERHEKIGVELGKKIAIFEAWEKGLDIQLLSNVFSLPTDQILSIIDEMKKKNEKK